MTFQEICFRNSGHHLQILLSRVKQYPQSPIKGLQVSTRVWSKIQPNLIFKQNFKLHRFVREYDLTRSQATTSRNTVPFTSGICVTLHHRDITEDAKMWVKLGAGSRCLFIDYFFSESGTQPKSDIQCGWISTWPEFTDDHRRFYEHLVSRRLQFQSIGSKIMLWDISENKLILITDKLD